jgi:hypothetical protein
MQGQATWLLSTITLKRGWHDHHIPCTKQSKEGGIGLSAQGDSTMSQKVCFLTGDEEKIHISAIINGSTLKWCKGARVYQDPSLAGFGSPSRPGFMSWHRDQSFA